LLADKSWRLRCTRANIGLPPLNRRCHTAATQLVIDGYEQLSWWSRRRMKSLCRRCRAGLIVTAHTDVGLPTIYRTEPSVQLAGAVVAQLLGDGKSLVTASDIAAAYDATGGNMRETLFRLYDVYHEKAVSSPRTHRRPTLDRWSRLL